MVSVLEVMVNDLDGGLYPSEPQNGGVYGDNGALVLAFSPLDETYRYQIEVVDGGGCYDITEPLNVQEGMIRYAVPSAWTAPGIATVRLVAVGEGDEAVIRHYAPIRLRFSDREQGTAMGEMLPRWQTVMAESVTATRQASAAAWEAEIAALTAREAAEIARQAKGEKGDKGDIGPQGPKGPKGDPGDGVLHVTISTDADGNEVASHHPTVIYNFVNEGGIAFLEENYFLYDVTTDNASFYSIDTNTRGVIKINDAYIYVDSDYKYRVRRESKVYNLSELGGGVDSSIIGDIDTALENIMAIQERLIGGDEE